MPWHVPIMKLHHLALTLAALASTAVALPAAACTVAAGYRAPTNLELAAEADAILIGRVAAGTGAEAQPVVEPIEALKGLLPGQPFPLPGMLDAAVPPSDPQELEQPHPNALAGACRRHLFAPGATVLFFLDRQEGEWVPAGGPFARWAEDVPGPDAPWLQLTRLYLRAAALPEEDRRALLTDEYEALEANGEDPLAQRLMADIGRSLTAPPRETTTIEYAPEPAPQAEPAEAPAPAEEELDAVQRGIDSLEQN